MNTPTAQDIQEGDHLAVGQIYSILPEEKVSAVCKIIGLEADCLHLYVYRKILDSRPISLEQIQEHLSISPNVEECRDNHATLSRKLFSLWRPVYLGVELPSDNELSGYRQWQLCGGGEILGNELHVEKKPDNKCVYVKIFSISAISFGVLMGLYQGFRYGPLMGTVVGAASGVVFGCLMAFMQWLGVKNQRCSPDMGSAAPAQIQELDLAAPFDKAYDSCIRALMELEKCTLLVTDKIGGTIEARVATAGKQIICVTLYRVGQDRTGIIVSSDPEEGDLVDYGKNIWNVETVVSYLQTLATNGPIVRRSYVNRVEKTLGAICAVFFSLCAIFSYESYTHGRAEWWVPLSFVIFVAMGLYAFLRK